MSEEQVHSEILAVPKHIAIIMDGNGRWAAEHQVPRIEGHRKGSEVAHTIIKTAAKLNIKYLTLYAFSYENWYRDPLEVAGLMDLLEHYLKTEIITLHQEGVALKVIGERHLLPTHILDLINAAEDLTKNNTKVVLFMALSYGSRAEILQAMQSLGKKIQENLISPEDIDEDMISQSLYTAGAPDPDLLIRTSGECRISNFLLWQIAYTELVFFDKFWPDFTEEDFQNALISYQERERRYGRRS